MTLKKLTELNDRDLVLRAVYELSLEACGGNKELLDSLGDDENPKILDDDIKKRWLELKKKRDMGLEQ